MNYSQLLTDVNEFFTGVTANELYILRSPSIYGYSDNLKKPHNHLLSSDLDMALLIIGELEANGIDWRKCCKLGSLQRAFYQVKVNELTKKGY